MSNPFNWLRLIRIALSVFVVIISVASGIPVGTNRGQTDPFELLTRLAGGVAEFAEDGTSRNGEGDGVLGEIVDEPIGAVGEPGAVLPPSSGGSAGVGGVLGGGESLGPNGSPVTPVATVPPTVPAGGPVNVPPTDGTRPTATAPADPDPSPAPQTSPLPSPSLTPGRPTPSPPPTPTISASPAPLPTPAEIRLDEPVLRFLPEISAAGNATGVPASILAGVVRVESNGDPNVIANGRRFGLTGVSDAALVNLGIPTSSWHDPASNILAGASVLAGLHATTGSWDLALEAYFGGECDATGVCPAEYRYAVLAWSNYYAGAVSSAAGGGFAALPPTWTAPALAPYHGASIRPIPLPPGVAAPTPTPAPTEPPTPTVPVVDTPDDSDGGDETAAPEPTASPTPAVEVESTPTSTVAPA